MKSLGRQFLCELRGCDPALLNRPERVMESLRAAAIAAGATPVNEVVHAFAPHGVTGVILLAESHLAIHTWPEHGFAAVDLFTCGPTVDAARAVDHLRSAFSATDVSFTEVPRGIIDTP